MLLLVLGPYGRRECVATGAAPPPILCSQEWPALLCHAAAGEETFLLVVPRTKTEMVIDLAHTPHGRTSGSRKHDPSDLWLVPLARPGGQSEAVLPKCPTSQRTSPQRPPPGPLIPLHIIKVPFGRIGMDLVGPLPKSARGHEHFLVIVDYATHYPEAIPLRKVTAKVIAKELFMLLSRVGLPTEILTDQGTLFISQLMADLCWMLKVKQFRTSIYHPQTDWACWTLQSDS